VHAPTDPLPLGALAPTAPARSAPMGINTKQGTNFLSVRLDGYSNNGGGGGVKIGGCFRDPRVVGERMPTAARWSLGTGVKSIRAE